MNNLRLLTVSLAVALSGCSIIAAEWIMTVMTPEQLFEIAESSSQLRPFFSKELEARQSVKEARTGYLPDVDISLSVSYIGDGFTVKRNFSDYQRAPIPHLGNGFAVNITQPVYTGGVVSTNVELAEMNLTASRYATELQRDNIRFRLVGFYLDIYKYTNLREVLLNNIAQAKKVLDEMNARYEHGTALRNDITRYELLVSNLELQLIKINNTIEILNNNLVTIANLPSDIMVVPDSTILSRSFPVDGRGAWQSEAQVNSPAIMLARAKADINRKTESLVKAERLPKIGIQAGWSLDGPILVEVPPINRNLSYWYVGLGVSYNLSSLWKNNKSRARSRAATLVADDELLTTRENVEMAVCEDNIRYLEAYEELKTQQKSVELADRNYITTSTRYSADMALITDMLDAANAKLDAEQRLVNARINIIYYYYKLLFTSGKI